MSDEKIDKYFTKDCTLDTTLRQAYYMGFQRGMSEADKDTDADIKTEYDEVKDIWNSLDGLGNIKAIRAIGDGKRKDNTRARLKEYSLDGFKTCVENIRQSSFLQGHNGKGWAVTFDWLIKPSNFPKVLEGNYNDKGGKGYIDTNFRLLI